MRELQAARSRQLAERERRGRLLELHPADCFDPTRYLKSGDAEYREKVQKHFHLASWAYSERKEDPALRAVMLLLLENGYGIEDYSNVIRVLSFHKAEVESLRARYERLGFYTALEIEDLWKASGAYCRQAEHWEGARRSFARQRIPDVNLVEALGAVDIGLVGGRVCGGAGRVFGNGKRDDDGAGGGLARANAEGSGAMKKRAHSRRAAIYAGIAVRISLSSIA